MFLFPWNLKFSESRIKSIDPVEDHWYTFQNFLLDIFFIYISNVIPLSSFPSENPLSLPPAHQTTHSCFLALWVPYTGAYYLIRTKGLSSHWWLGIPLLHMQLEPWVPQCIFFGWWFNLRELWRYWSVHIVVPPRGLKTPLAPWTFSLASSLGTCALSNRWLWASTSVLVKHRQSLSGNSYIRLLSASFCWHQQSCLILMVAYGMEVIPLVSSPHFVSLTPSMCILFPLLRRTEVSTLWSSLFLSFRNITYLIDKNSVCLCVFNI
jgi:hypothetical protein